MKLLKACNNPPVKATSIPFLTTFLLLNRGERSDVGGRTQDDKGAGKALTSFTK